MGKFYQDCVPTNCNQGACCKSSHVIATAMAQKVAWNTLPQNVCVNVFLFHIELLQRCLWQIHHVEKHARSLSHKKATNKNAPIVKTVIPGESPIYYISWPKFGFRTFRYQKIRTLDIWVHSKQTNHLDNLTIPFVETLKQPSKVSNMTWTCFPTIFRESRRLEPKKQKHATNNKDAAVAMNKYIFSNNESRKRESIQWNFE